MKYHTPVLLQEVLKFLNPKPGDLVIDTTVGGGGHTFEFLKRGAEVLGIDRDPEAIEHIKSEVRSSKFEVRTLENLVLVQGNFAKIGEIARRNGFGQVSGILFDLGVSSHQLEKPERGFSFLKEGPLDMRMDPTLTIKASDIINHFDQRRLNEIFKTYAQEKLSWCFAGAICRARQIKPIETTTELARIIKEARGVRKHFGGKIRGPRRKLGVVNIHPATRVFQALRIVVNSELLNLEQSLPQTVELLKKGGRLAIISFHSLEDAQVKRFFKRERRLKILTKKPIGPSLKEVLENPRSRSAKLRVAEKI